MFFEGDRIKSVREMILASDVEGRKAALAKLLPMQRGDFEGIFEAMDGFGVTIRLLDPLCTSSCLIRPQLRRNWPTKWVSPSLR